MNKKFTKIYLRKNLVGQNVIEYLLVTAVVVLICIIFFHPVTGPARGKLDNILNITVEGINGLKNQIQF